jgi:hypothetical protein
MQVAERTFGSSTFFMASAARLFKLCGPTRRREPLPHACWVGVGTEGAGCVAVDYRLGLDPGALPLIPALRAIVAVRVAARLLGAEQAWNRSRLRRHQNTTCATGQR